MFVAVAALAALAASFYEPPGEAVTIGTRSYVIPPGEVSSLTLEPYVFVRIRPDERGFEIVHDSRASGRHDRTGVPHVFSVNDRDGNDLRYARDKRTTIVCRRAGGCGTWISQGGADWSILFPESRIGEADSFVREAMALLRKYDTRSSRLVP
jgi:hypothetical protein